MLTRRPTATRWVVLVVATLSIAVLILAATTHEDGDGPSCLLCKLGHEPIELAPAVETPHAPITADSLPGELATDELAFQDQSLQPRAPPV